MPNTIAENLTRLQTARTDIANAITAMGGTVTSGDGFEEFPADIATIPSGTEIGNTVVITSSGQLAKMLAGSTPDGDAVVSSKMIFVQDGAVRLPTSFVNLQALERLSFPKSLTIIHSGAFNNCKGIESVCIPSGVSSIEAGAFGGCTGLKAVTISSGITSIEQWAFGGCDNLKAIIIDKPENSISGAPWGATNATVVWTG